MQPLLRQWVGPYVVLQAQVGDSGFSLLQWLHPIYLPVNRCCWVATTCDHAS